MTLQDGHCVDFQGRRSQSKYLTQREEVRKRKADQALLNFFAYGLTASDDLVIRGRSSGKEFLDDGYQMVGSHGFRQESIGTNGF